MTTGAPAAQVTPEAATGGADVDRRKLLAVVMIGIFATAFPYTVLSASLDTIRVDLGTSLSTISWLQVAPALASGVAVPIFGKFCDVFGARRVFLVSIGLTVVFSVLTACAWNAAALIALRTIGQTVGAASGPAGFTVVSHWFTGSDRARAMGRVGSMSAIAPITGVAVGGPLVDWLGWQMLFLLQAIPAAAALVLALLWLRDSGVRQKATFDVAGAVLLATTVVAALFGLNRLRPWGVAHAVVLACFAATPLLAYAFTVVERRQVQPLAPLHYLRRREFSLALLTMALVQFTFMGGSVVIPLVMLRRYGYSLTLVTWLAAARPVGFAIGSSVSSAVRARWGPVRAQVVAAMVLTGSMGVLVYAAGRHVPLVLVAGFVFAGFSSGISYTTVLTSINDLADRADIGVANGIASMMSTVGSAVGVTVVSAIVADSQSSGPFVAGFAVLVAVCVLMVLTGWAGSARWAARPQRATQV